MQVPNRNCTKANRQILVTLKITRQKILAPSTAICKILRQPFCEPRLPQKGEQIAPAIPLKEKIIPAIEKQGIGNIEEIRQSLVSPKETNANVDDKISNLQDTIKEKEEKVKVLTETLETINSLEQRNSELDKQIEELVNKINGRQL